jgi:hypothetical protein
MIRIDKCVKTPDCIVITLGNHLSLMTEEDQIYFIGWMKENKPELLK